MSSLYSKLGERMGGAIEAGAEVRKGESKLDYINKMYDIKRQRMEKLFTALGQTAEIGSRVSDIYSRNQKLKSWAEKKGYEADLGFLGLGKPKFTYTPESEYMENGIMKQPEIEEVSMYDIVFGEEDADIRDAFELFGGGRQ